MDRKQKKWPFLEFKVVIWGGGETRGGNEGVFNRDDEAIH